jgi:hypothetical protein
MTNTPKRWAALGLAAALCTVETWLLISGQAEWFTPQVAVVVSSTIALAVAPLLFEEVSGWFRIAAWVGCFLLACFVFGAVLDRSSHTVRLATATSESATESRGRVETELSDARDSLRHAVTKAEAETNNGGCGPKCMFWQGQANSYQFAIDGHLAKLEAMKPVVANTGAKTLAELTGVSERFLLLIWPIPQPMAFQFMIWALVRVWGSKARVSAKETVSEPEIGAGGGGKGLQLIQGGKVTDRELDEVRNALIDENGNPRVLCNNDLARAMGVVKGEGSKRVDAAIAAGLVTRRRVGRHVAIQLNAH